MKILIIISLMVILINICGSFASTIESNTDKPIIIKTQARSYEHPSIKEYEECHRNRDQCLDVCESHNQPEICKAECIICPILIDQDVLIQGINDTLYKSETQNIMNTTNKIYLTNEIRNVISTFMGNITAINDNKINVYQNSSSQGGKFGLGYNMNGDCCQAVLINKDCQKSSFERSIHCRHKRHRLCGVKCKARIMYAKKIETCDDMGNCKPEIEYYIPPENQQLDKCKYSENWPFIKCPNGVKQTSTICDRCLSIPYGYILHHGLPRQCRGCNNKNMPYFNQLEMPHQYYSNPYPYLYPYANFYPPIHHPTPQFYEPLPISSFNYFPGEGIPTYFDQDEWRMVSKKCQNEDGIIQDCEEGVITPENNIPIVSSHEDDYYDDENLEIENGKKTKGFIGSDRFRRSSYSKRYA